MVLPAIPGKAPTQAAVDAAWYAQLRSWRNQLGACAQKASRRRVHTLRVATLRLLSSSCQMLPPPVKSPASRAVREWTKQAEKLRQVLSHVREFDVYRSRLTGLLASLDVPNATRLHTNREILRQIDCLGARLKQHRRAAAERLTARIAKSLPRLCEASDAMERAMRAAQVQWAEQSIASGIAAFMADFPEPDASNLHDLRKRIKALRYMVEAAGSSDMRTRKLLRILRATQTAIGTWHDWDDLARKARQLLRDQSAPISLIALLDEVAAEWLERATETCKRSRAKLDRLWRETERAPATTGKLPVERARSAPAARMQRRA
jgi:CHAD domain-containing protein